jgi:hypothetical protein
MKVRANHGAAGQTVADIKADLSNTLSKLWSRMSSGKLQALSSPTS